MALVCIPYIFVFLPVPGPGQLGFCLFLHCLNHENLVYLSISCTLSELQSLSPFNCAFLTPLWGPSNQLDRVEQGTHPLVGALPCTFQLRKGQAQIACNKTAKVSDSKNVTRGKQFRSHLLGFNQQQLENQ